jgi:hypothetical protein
VHVSRVRMQRTGSIVGNWGPALFLCSGYRGSFPQVERPEPEADSSPAPSAEAIRLHGVVLH